MRETQISDSRRRSSGLRTSVARRTQPLLYRRPYGNVAHHRSYYTSSVLLRIIIVLLGRMFYYRFSEWTDVEKGVCMETGNSRHRRGHARYVGAF